MKREFYFKIILAIVCLGIIFYLGALGINDLRIATTNEYKKNWKDVKVVMEDETIKDYRLNKIKVLVDDQEHDFLVIPMQINGKKCDSLYDEAFIDKYKLVYDTDIDISSPNADIQIIYPNNTRLNSLSNSEQDYLNQVIDTNDVSFKSIGKGVYSVNLKMGNGDLLQIVFK